MTKASTKLETKPAQAPPLGKAVTRGFSWMLAQTLSTKLLNTGGQIILAWLLVPKDFGLIGLAYTVTAFISVLQQAGLQEILIHRQSQFKRWANPAFWLSACLGVGSMILTLAAIPLAQRIYAAPQLGGLLVILSIRALLSSLIVVPQSKLSNELRFKALAVIGVVAAGCNTILACLLAWEGWGAYAIAIGSVAGVMVNLVLMWQAAPHSIKTTMQIRRWRFILGDSAAILATGLLWVITSQGDYMVLGIFHNAALTGLYFFAFNLSMQTLSLFSANLDAVLFPSLSRLQNEPRRHAEAFLKATRLLSLLVIPICLLQAAVANPVVRLIFPSKWYAAIPVLEILSVAMAFQAVGFPGWAMIKSQGRFKTLMYLTAGYAIFYLTFVTLGSWLGGIVAVAVAEGVYFALMNPLHLYAAVFPMRIKWSAIVGVFAPALTAGVVAVGVGWIVSRAIPWSGAVNILRIVTVLFISGPLYILMIRLLAPDDSHELLQRLKAFYHAKRRTRRWSRDVL